MIAWRGAPASSGALLQASAMEQRTSWPRRWNQLRDGAKENDEGENRPMPSILSTMVVMFTQLLVVGMTIFLVLRLVKGRSSRTPRGVIEADDGRIVPVRAAFAGIKGFPWWFAIATNNLNPSLVILPSGIRYRTIRKHERAFAEIAQIDIRTAWKTVNIDLQFHGELLTFAANVGTEAAAREALALFPAAVPMTSRAKAILAGPSA